MISVPDISGYLCVARIERVLADSPDVVAARANLTLRQARVTLTDADTDPSPVFYALGKLGFDARPMELYDSDPTSARQRGLDLLRCIAVAESGAMSVMLLSVAFWAGAEAAIRETFHLISTLIAVPVVAHAGQPFLCSGVAALRSGLLNMEGPHRAGGVAGRWRSASSNWRSAEIMCSSMPP